VHTIEFKHALMMHSVIDLFSRIPIYFLDFHVVCVVTPCH